MYEMIKQYSETAYITKQELSKQFQNMTLEKVWQEIIAYRSLFQTHIKLFDKTYVITYNPYVYKRLLQTSELLYQNNSMQHVDVIQLYHELRMTHNYRFDINWLAYLCDKNIPLLVRFYLVFLCKEKESELIYEQLKKAYGCDQLTALSYEELRYQINAVLQEDITYGLIEYLTFINSHLSKRMVLYNQASQINSVEELVKRYPHLNKKQLHFFIHHRKPFHYYTILDYKQETGVCYESARQAMDALAQVHLYHKQKIGKRFVYSL